MIYSKNSRNQSLSKNGTGEINGTKGSKSKSDKMPEEPIIVQSNIQSPKKSPKKLSNSPQKF